MIIQNEGYDLPIPGKLEDISYDLSVTVKPCPIFDVSKAPDQFITYMIGDPELKTDSYDFQ